MKTTLEKLLAMPDFECKMNGKTGTFRAMLSKELYAYEIPSYEESKIGAQGIAYLAQCLADITQKCVYLSVETSRTSKVEFLQVRLWEGDKKPEMQTPRYSSEVCHIDQYGNSLRGVKVLAELNLHVNSSMYDVTEECLAKVTDSSMNGGYASEYRGSRIYEFKPTGVKQK